MLQIVGPQLDPVLGHQQRDPEEAFGQQAGERGHPAGGRVADVDLAQVLVPVEGQRPQQPLQFVDEVEQVGHLGALYGAQRPGGPAGGLHRAHRGLGTQGRVQPALFPGEFGQPVQAGGERFGLARADPADQVLEALGEAPALTPGVRAAIVRRGPERGGPDAGDVLGQDDPAALLLLGAAAQRVELELVLRQPADQPVAPEPRLSRRIRITTFREQSDPHEWHPRSPVQAVAVRPVTRRGKLKRICR